MPKYYCLNLGVCPKSDSCEQFEVPEGEPFHCPISDPSCQEHRKRVETSGTTRSATRFFLYALIGLCVLIAAFYLFKPAAPPRLEDALFDAFPWLKQ
jgi:hypothetical protein